MRGDSNVPAGEAIDGGVLLWERSFMCVCLSLGCYVAIIVMLAIKFIGDRRFIESYWTLYITKF